MKPIESTGEHLTERERHRAALVHCQREISQQQRLLRLPLRELRLLMRERQRLLKMLRTSRRNG